MVFLRILEMLPCLPVDIQFDRISPYVFILNDLIQHFFEIVWLIVELLQGGSVTNGAIPPNSFLNSSSREQPLEDSVFTNFTNPFMIQ